MAGAILLPYPRGQVLRRFNAVRNNAIQQRTGTNRVKPVVNPRRFLLVRQLDDVSWPVIELASVAGCFILSGPLVRGNPNEFCAPGVIAHYDNSR